MLCSLLITITTAHTLYTTETSEPLMTSERFHLNDFERQCFINRNNPKDKTKTPASPDIIEHGGNALKGGRNFYRKRIYFGNDESGNPCYQTIWVHAHNNPAFNNVKLVIFHKASMLKLRSKDSFEIIGTYADKTTREQLIKSIAANGGVWCPEQNALIGNTRDTCIGDKFTEFIQKPTSQSKKIKKK